jgi:pimeloyl-ACP methyl ester carboxylesterase
MIRSRLALVLVAFGAAGLQACAGAAPRGKTFLDLDPVARAQVLFDGVGTAPRTLRLEDCEIRFVEAGPAKTPEGELPWIFIHGLGGTLGDFAPLFVAASAQHHVFALDLPGFGGSVMIAPDYSIPAFVHVLREFAVAVEVPRFHFVCHSLGGQVCIALSLDAPALMGSMTLIDAAGAYDQREFLERVSRGRIGRMRPGHQPGLPSDPRSGSELLWRLLGNEPTMLAAIGSFGQNYHNRVRDVRVPTFIVWGVADPIFPVDYGFYLKENIEGSTLRVVADAGHEPHLVEPQLVLGWINEFHDRLRAEGAVQ